MVLCHPTCKVPIWILPNVILLPETPISPVAVALVRMTSLSSTVPLALKLTVNVPVSKWRSQNRQRSLWHRVIKRCIFSVGNGISGKVTVGDKFATPSTAPISTVFC
jgi:hypothetical protein